MTVALKIPNLGDDDQEGIVVLISASVGDEVKVGDTLLEIETDKATMEIPADHAGTIENIMLDEGDKVKNGLEYMKIAPADIEELDESHEEVKKEKKESVNATIEEKNKEEVSDKHLPAKNVLPASGRGLVRAGPGARRLARELGVDISLITGTGKRSTISKSDVKAYVRQGEKETVNSIKPINQLPDFSHYGITRREALTSTAISTCENMQRAWSTIPHAWLQEKIDITELEQWRQENKQQIKEQGGSLTITVILACAAAKAMEKFPIINSSLDELTNEIVYKEYRDISIAVDTERGLLVPTLRQVDRKGLGELSKELSELVDKAHKRKLSPKDMQGGGLTISNLGGIGLSSIFPIINWPQVVILGLGASELVPCYRDGGIVPRQILTVTLGFDHRIINGADGAKFLCYLKDLCEDPRLLLL